MKKIPKIFMIFTVISLMFLSIFSIGQELEDGENNPIAIITANPVIGEIPLTVFFTGMGSVSNGTINSYHWDFGDGTISDEQNPTHTYTQSGSFTVIFTITDNKNITDDDSIIISVNPESEQSYKSSCWTNITYEQLNINAINYSSQRVTYTGRIAEIAKTSREFIIDVGNRDLIYLRTNKKINLVNNDTVQFWGEIKGYDFYLMPFSNWTIRMPSIDAIYIHKVEKETIPWFEIIIGFIIVICAIAFLYLRRQKKKVK